jgi:hypothetical protein
LARAELRSSGGACSHGFGGRTRYLGAGSYGVAFEREIGPAPQPKPVGIADSGGGRTALAAVVKLAAVEADEGAAIAKRLVEGGDASIEAFFYEAMVSIVAATNSPHVSIGYGTWVCPDILKPPVRLLHPKTSCTKVQAEGAKSVVCSFVRVCLRVFGCSRLCVKNARIFWLSILALCASQCKWQIW